MEAHERPPPSRGTARAQPIAVAAASRTGRRRTNADAFLFDEAAGFYAVSDGMGDTPRSALVAQMALAAVHEPFLAPWALYPRSSRSTREARGRLCLGVMQAHGRSTPRRFPRALRPGATFAGVVDCGESFAVGHVGDSRVYLLRAGEGRLARLTRDHTVAGDARRRGVARDAAVRLPDASNLTQAIGARCATPAETGAWRWDPGDTILLCTDGLSDPLDSEAIADILLGAPELGNAADRLLDGAMEAGGSDNAAVVLVRRTA